MVIMLNDHCQFRFGNDSTIIFLLLMHEYQYIIFGVNKCSKGKIKQLLPQTL